MRLLTLQILSTLTPRALCELPLFLLTGFPPPAALLAQIPAASGAGPVTLERAALGFLLFVNLFWAVLQIIRYFRRTPSIEAEFATKEDLRALRQELTASGDTRRNEIREELAHFRTALNENIRSLYDRINHDADALSISLQGIQRALGRLEAAAHTSGT